MGDEGIYLCDNVLIWKFENSQLPDILFSSEAACVMYEVCLNSKTYYLLLFDALSNVYLYNSFAYSSIHVNMLSGFHNSDNRIIKNFWEYPTGRQANRNRKLIIVKVFVS